jgi:hypothetical protein
MTTIEDIGNRFDYHAPDEEKQAKHVKARSMLQAIAYEFGMNLLPEGREKSLALTKLEEAMFWANAAIARN